MCFESSSFEYGTVLFFIATLVFTERAPVEQSSPHVLLFFCGRVCICFLQFLMLVVDHQTWNWNEPDGAEQLDTEEGASRDSEVNELPLNFTEEPQNKWEKLLRARYECFPPWTFASCKVRRGEEVLITLH